MTLPQEIVLPGPIAFVERSPYLERYRQYVVETARATGCHVEIDNDLRMLSWSVMPVYVDGNKIGIDFSDFTQFTVPLNRVEYLFRIQHTPEFEHHPGVGSFPQFSFLDWNQYARLSETLHYNPHSTAISNRISFRESIKELKMQRRAKARAVLQEHFSSRLKTDWLNSEDFFRDSLNCRVHVHIPGSWPNMLDRSVIQLFGLGGVVVCTDIFTTCCEVRPQPNVHYIQMRDDFSDLPEVIEWCDKNQDALLVISANAKRFFEQYCMPKAIWSYIRSCLLNERRTK